MADELDELVAADISIIERLEVPELWERIVTLADTERSEPRRPRRWWPALLAAAVVVAVVAVTVIASRRDTPTHVDGTTPPTTPSSVVAASGDNVVRIEAGPDGFAVTPTATAGWVSFEIDNGTEQIRVVGINPLLPGTTVADVEAALRADDAGAEDPFTGVLPEAPLVGAFNMPGDQHTVGAPVEAGDYVVVSTELDGELLPVPGTGHAAALRVAPGQAGQMPTPTLTYQFIGKTPIGATSTDAGRVTLVIDEDPDDAPHEILLADLTDGAGASVWDNWSPWNVGNSPPFDWNEAPVDSLIAVWGTAPGRTVTVELDPGPIVLMGGVSLEQMDYLSVANIQVD
jgi:hypothetical protein